MKKLLAILTVAMLFCGAAYATTTTANNLDNPLSSTTILKINILGKFYLIVTPDLTEIELDTDTGLVQSETISVIAGSGEAIDWYLKVGCSDFSNGAATPITFEPDELKLIFYPAKDSSNQDKGDVLNNFGQASNGAPLSNTVANVYKPKTAHKQGVHACNAITYGNMPAVSQGIYQATLTFQMVAGVPA